MRATRELLAGGAALVLLAGAAHAGPSSAREREETRQLNLEASQQPPQIKARDAAANLADNAPPAAAPTLRIDVAEAPPLAPMALNSLPNPPDKIATAKVVDDKGTVVGQVQKVEMDPSGKPTKVDIALLGSDQVVALDSAQLSYDATNNVVATALDKSQIALLAPQPRG